MFVSFNKDVFVYCPMPIFLFPDYGQTLTNWKLLNYLLGRITAKLLTNFDEILRTG